ncbi:hypothetical protein CN918_32645 [Priestia megaterium]|nr:hypothetical protein CN918_32645 [Priestia megaterium]
MDYLENILHVLDEDRHKRVIEVYESIMFKISRNNYHFSNIKRVIDETDMLNVEDVYSSLNLPIYFEMESLLVSLRSTVDMLMHLLNEVYGLRLTDVYLNNVFKHPKLPSEIKNILRKYTRRFDNTTWSFIYTSRNDIVHEKSIPHILPINVDPFQFEQINVFFTWEGMEREIVSFFKQCLKFLSNFSSQLYENIVVSLR